MFLILLNQILYRVHPETMLDIEVGRAYVLLFCICLFQSYKEVYSIYIKLEAREELVLMFDYSKFLLPDLSLNKINSYLNSWEGAVCEICAKLLCTSGKFFLATSSITIISRIQLFVTSTNIKIMKKAVCKLYPR